MATPAKPRRRLESCRVVRLMSWTAGGTLALAFVFGLPGADARADIVRAGYCSDLAGETCSTAGPDHNSPGVCVQDTCSRPLPPVSGAASMVSSYPCLTCQLVKTDAGADAVAMTAIAGGGPGRVSDGDTKAAGCSYAPRSSRSTGPVGLGLIMLGAWLRQRSRQKSHRR
jgi:hypothetical protein